LAVLVGLCGRDLDVFGLHADVTCGGLHGACRLGIGLTGVDVDAALHAAHGAAGDGGGALLAFGHLVGRAVADAHSGGAQAGFGLLRVVAGGAGVLCGVQGDVAPGLEAEVLLGHGGAGLQGDVLACGDADGVAFQATALGLAGLALTVVLAAFAGEKAAAGALVFVVLGVLGAELAQGDVAKGGQGQGTGQEPDANGAQLRPAQAGLTRLAGDLRCWAVQLIQAATWKYHIDSNKCLWNLPRWRFLLIKFSGQRHLGGGEVGNRPAPAAVAAQTEL
jgi:hypothetical protein